MIPTPHPNEIQYNLYSCNCVGGRRHDRADGHADAKLAAELAVKLTTCVRGTQGAGWRVSSQHLPPGRALAVHASRGGRASRESTHNPVAVRNLAMDGVTCTDAIAALAPGLDVLWQGKSRRCVVDRAASCMRLLAEGMSRSASHDPRSLLARSDRAGSSLAHSHSCSKALRPRSHYSTTPCSAIAAAIWNGKTAGECRRRHWSASLGCRSTQCRYRCG